MSFQTSSQICGLVYGTAEHHLDHIATLCACLDIPLIVTDEDIEKMAKTYYPQLVIFYFSYLDAPTQIIQNYDAIITAMPHDLFDSIFFLAKTLVRKNPLTIWCPHGNSDKGSFDLSMQGLQKEKVAFIYGQKMLDLFKEKKALTKDCFIIPIGNYRFEFYHQHQTFYQKIIKDYIQAKFTVKQPTYLYAPTWNDAEKGSSFHSACPYLLENLPSNINLIIKLHPNTLLGEDIKLKKLFWKYESEPNVLFLENFPLVYPLLDLVDVYIGDTSSIGYDFITFNKPMFFLLPTETMSQRYLHNCGTIIDTESFPSIYPLIHHHLTTDKTLFSKKREETYHYTFAKHESFSKILADLHQLAKKHVLG